MVELNTTTSEIIMNTKTLISKSYLDKIKRQNDQFKFYDYYSISTGNMDSYFTLAFDHHIDMILSSLMNMTKSFDVSAAIVAQSDIDTIKFNYYRELKPRIMEYSSTLYEYLLNETSSMLRTQFGMIVLLICEALVSIIFLIYFIWLKSRILRKKQEILFLFLDIPREEVTEIKKKCEAFIQFCSVIYYLRLEILD